MSRTIVISTRLGAEPDRVWEEVNSPRLLLFVAAPMIRFRPVDPPVFAERWADGPHEVEMYLFGRIPLGLQVIDISRPAAAGGKWRLRDNGRSASIPRWDHLIEVAAGRDGTIYSDTVTIEAGWRTPLVAAFAKRFYAHRQRRWRALVAADFDYGAVG
ncbi:hypothetical protein [Jannaschia aquimarina]|uniref:Polyketide cyclase / dehydrase and lipid transport n=1 Tax=Jannaschia aquimarina TaxID=935700 RepID=A0A0D1EFQ5_9RHOB|nr:hypothetical protein [Jannaschia aquimarina]KIT16509.1 hypothetical protein jaqu_17370 [Jannaschia aquimarina]SNT06858.1 hypothetical protein SAMN05421775_105108 [Jannaschia aquimarina]